MLRPLGKQGDVRRRIAPRSFLAYAFALATDSVKLFAAFCILTLAACTHDRTAFDGNAALGYVKTQLDFGPRVPGTPPHEKEAEWLVAQMRLRADTVIEQNWTHVTAQRRALPMHNILARFNPASTQRILYVTHWDTRPTSDQDTNLGARALPIAGANDGASGPALFLALGDLFKKEHPAVGLDLLFVDGEDWGSFSTYSDTASNPDVLIGSAYFATHLPSADYKPLFGVLWDMIGDRDLQIFQEANSAQAAPEVVQRVWQTAADLGYEKYFIPQVKVPVTDDQVPLLAHGLRVIDVIDIDYCRRGVDCDPMGPDNFHHTQQDTFDKVSAKSLKIVGDVAVALMAR